MRIALLVTALILVAFAPLASADWTHEAGDPGRSGWVEAGPTWSDIAYQIKIPQAREAARSTATPLIVGDAVYALTWSYFYPTTAESVGDFYDEGAWIRVWRLDLVSGRLESLASWNSTRMVFGLRPSFATDGTTLFVEDGRDLFALDAATGSVRWTVPLQLEPRTEGAPVQGSECADPAVEDGVVYLACVTGYEWDHRTTAVALDADDGALLWRWVKDAEPPVSPSAAQRDLDEGDYCCRALVSALTPTRSPYGPRVIGVTVSGPSVLLRVDEFGSGGIQDRYVTVGGSWELDRETGVSTWRWNDSPEVVDDNEDTTGVPTYPYLASAGGIVLREGTDANLYDASDLAGGATVSIRFRSDLGEDDLGSASAIAPDGFVFTGRSHIVQADAAFDITWRHYLDEEWVVMPGAIAVSPALVYVRAGSTDRHQLLKALDRSNGALAWETVVGADTSFAVSDGIAAVLSVDGELLVLGIAPGSIRPLPALSTATPAPGDLLAVDLSGTTAGAYGPASAFRAEWGDGTSTDWQASPLLSHRYAQPSDYEARFYARNDAGQTSSTPQTIRVGAPAELNAIQRAFSAEEQDRTWGIIGILIAMAGGLIAVLSRRRRRSRLQRALDRIDADVAARREDPIGCELVLDGHRTAVKRDLRAGLWDEGQASVLERHVEDLQRRLRLSTLDDRFQFLPHGVVLMLRDMLADGRINVWERDHVMRAIDEARGLSDAQRADARRLVEGWATRDQGTN